MVKALGVQATLCPYIKHRNGVSIHPDRHSLTDRPWTSDKRQQSSDINTGIPAGTPRRHTISEHEKRMHSGASPCSFSALCTLYGAVTQ